MKHGENKIRIVSEAEPYGKHYNPETKKTLVCIGKDKGCEGCQQGNKPRVQWLLWVIDRTDNKIKMLEIGYSILQQISKLAQSQEYGFEIIPNYDITITKEGEGLETEYTVIPARKDTLLIEVEREEIENLESPIEIIRKKKEKLEEPF
ncbi:MAG: hypothetical protein AB1393_13845 [Candidatus Edwardsbacteria bacterium]